MLSIVIPAFNEQDRITNSLLNIQNHLEEYKSEYEIVVIDDGSSDNTAKIVSDMARSNPRIMLVQLGQNMGKGAAVRKGVFISSGDRILITDADLSTPIEELEVLETNLDSGADIAIGSRALQKSKLLKRQPMYRELLGKMFNILVQKLYLPGFKDTQCGFKLFDAAAAKDVFARQKLERFVFDVEILWLATRLNYTIQEVPVSWRDVPGTKLSSNIKTVFQVWNDLLSIKRLHNDL